MKPAYVLGIATDEEGNVYCACEYLKASLTAQGVTEYTVQHAAPKLVRSFYAEFLQFPPSLIAVDGNGTLYLASETSNIRSGNIILVFDKDVVSGRDPSRIISSAKLGIGRIAALTADSMGRVYVAYESTHGKPEANIAVFSNTADGDTPPLRVIRNPAFDFGENAFGNLLEARDPVRPLMTIDCCPGIVPGSNAEPVGPYRLE
jgi:hypothetical protein